MCMKNMYVSTIYTINRVKGVWGGPTIYFHNKWSSAVVRTEDHTCSLKSGSCFQFNRGLSLKEIIRLFKNSSYRSMMYDHYLKTTSLRKLLNNYMFHVYLIRPVLLLCSLRRFLFCSCCYSIRRFLCCSCCCMIRRFCSHWFCCCSSRRFWLHSSPCQAERRNELILYTRMS